MIEIAKFTGAQVVGLNPCEYQLKRVKYHIEKNNMQDYCSGVKVSISFKAFTELSVRLKTLNVQTLCLQFLFL